MVQFQDQNQKKKQNNLNLANKRSILDLNH